jgi:hypothetical protein
MDGNHSSLEVDPPGPPDASALALESPSCPASERLQEVIELLQAEIEQHYGIPILFVDVPAGVKVDHRFFWQSGLPFLEALPHSIIHPQAAQAAVERW